MQHIIFDNWDTTDLEKGAIEYLLSEKPDEYKSKDDIPQFVIEKEVEYQLQWQWNDFENFITCMLRDCNLLLKGSLGTWQGRREGGKVIHEFKDFLSFWKDCDFIKVYDEGGHLYIEAVHHDGTNYAELRTLTRKGEDFLQRHEWENDEYTHNVIFSSNIYGGLPHYAHRFYGCKKYA